MSAASKHPAGQQRQAAEKVVRVLQEAGHTAYFAGGCVRDMLLGLEPTDYDVATEARPPQVCELFRSTRLVGEAFGVVLVRLMQCEIEVATFRTEWGYADGRRPDHVDFSDAEHDAQRRDFTVNGMFYDPITRQVIDYVGGQADLEARLIRCIGDPDERFDEDYLRLLRAVRFAARLGWSIDADTAQAIGAHGPKLSRISRERIAAEVQMMLERDSRAAAVRLLNRFELDGIVLNEDHQDEGAAILGSLPREADYDLALAAWALDRHLHIDDPIRLTDALRSLKAVQIARRWRSALMLSNTHTDRFRALLRKLPGVLDWPSLNVAERKRLLARTDWQKLRLLAGMLPGVERAIDPQALDEQAARLFDEGVAPKPLITGDDLVAAGFQPGPAFKTILDRVYDAQLMARIATAEQALTLARRIAEQLQE